MNVPNQGEPPQGRRTVATSQNVSGMTLDSATGAPTSATTLKRFRTRHLSVMALGSAIGAGFFLGTGVAISEAGPAVLMSYALAALIAVSVMFALSGLASALPSTGSFSTYAEVGIGHWAGFASGWLYWAMLIMVLGMEIIGAAGIFVQWFPSIPQWTVTPAIVIVLGGVNLMATQDFSEVEAWLTGIKVVAIILFPIIGIALVFGLIPRRTEPVGHMIMGYGDSAPKGFAGIAIGLFAIITSFGGIEIVTIAAAEARDVKSAMLVAIRSVIGRILVFYVDSAILLICLLPWDSEEIRKSPFAALLNMADVLGVGRTMEAVVFIALISAFSANVYASSRTAYSLSAQGTGMCWLPGKNTGSLGRRVDAGAAVDHAEEIFNQVAHSGDKGGIVLGRTPGRAVAASIVLALVSVVLDWFLPETFLGVLLNAIGTALLIIWVFILIAQVRFHPLLEEKAAISPCAPGWPWLPRLVLLVLVGVVGLMAWDPATRAQLISMTVLTIIVIALFLAKEAVENKLK